MTIRTKALRTCGTCKHWVNAVPYKWGTCEAQIPAWLAGEYRSPVIHPDNDMADRCDSFTSARRPVA